MRNKIVKIQAMFLAMLWAMFLLPACAQDAPTMHDGYYTAEAADFDAEGWKPFITICVSNNKIVTVEYNAKNVSGFIKSWDVDYMRRMRDAAGIYPSKYIRAYAAALLDKQNPALINVIPGSEKSHILFKILSEAVISQARTGDKSIVFITYPPTDLERLS